jgi:hypothetical protein
MQELIGRIPKAIAIGDHYLRVCVHVHVRVRVRVRVCVCSCVYIGSSCANARASRADAQGDSHGRALLVGAV